MIDDLKLTYQLESGMLPVSREEQDIVRFMKELGINLVRVPFNYRLFMEDERPGEWRQEGVACFDYLFRSLSYRLSYHTVG